MGLGLVSPHRRENRSKPFLLISVMEVNNNLIWNVSGGVVGVCVCCLWKGGGL